MWSFRRNTYQCAGGNQTSFGLTANGAANCKDTALGRLSGRYSNSDSSSFYGTQDTTWCPMQRECLDTFSCPWFPNVSSPDQGNWLIGTFLPPKPGFTMFRLPALPLSSRTCTPSPFVNSSIYSNNNRPAYTSWNPVVPTQCGNDMTLSITDLIGSGYYSTSVGQGANVTLSLGADNNTVTCAYTLGSSFPFGLTVTNVLVVVTDGPVFAADDPLYSGNPSSPYWQVGLRNVSSAGKSTGSGSVVLTQMLNDSAARSYTRVVDCVVTGFNNQTGLPFQLTAAQPYVVEIYGQGWLPYSYPMAGNYTYSGPPTRAPTTMPTQRPTSSPTVAPTGRPTAPTPSPTQAPTCLPAPAPVWPPKIGFLVLEPSSFTICNVPPGSNAFSGYEAGTPHVQFDTTSNLAGGWNNTSFEYAAPSTGCDICRWARSKESSWSRISNSDLHPQPYSHLAAGSTTSITRQVLVVAAVGPVSKDNYTMEARGRQRTCSHCTRGTRAPLPGRQKS